MYTRTWKHWAVLLTKEMFSCRVFTINLPYGNSNVKNSDLVYKVVDTLLPLPASLSSRLYYREGRKRPFRTLTIALLHVSKPGQPSANPDGCCSAEPYPEKWLCHQKLHGRPSWVETCLCANWRWLCVGHWAWPRGQCPYCKKEVTAGAQCTNRWKLSHLWWSCIEKWPNWY